MATITESTQTGATIAPRHAFDPGTVLLVCFSHIESGLDFPISGDRIAEARWEAMLDARED